MLVYLLRSGEMIWASGIDGIFAAACCIVAGLTITPVVLLTGILGYPQFRGVTTQSKILKMLMLRSLKIVDRRFTS